MPFKTKSKKIAAFRHRVGMGEHGLLTYSEPGQSGDSGEEGLAKFGRKITGTGNIGGAEVRNEVGKIVLFAAVIIGLQIALKLSKIPLIG